MKYWDKAWSIVEGCTPVSPACENCWLKAMDKRFGREWDSNVVARTDRLDIPLKTKKPTVFAIWSDLFHPLMPDDFILRAFEVIKATPQHTYLICTKRPARMAEIINYYIDAVVFDENIYLGTTVENQEMADKRMSELLKCRPFKLFLSVEPMLSTIDFHLTHEYFVNRIFDDDKHPIDCIIAGCESGKNARETKPEWIDNLRSQCKKSGTIFWLKQWRENGKLKRATDDSSLPWRKR